MEEVAFPPGIPPSAGLLHTWWSGSYLVASCLHPDLAPCTWRSSGAGSASSSSMVAQDDVCAVCVVSIPPLTPLSAVMQLVALTCGRVYVCMLTGQCSGQGEGGL